MQANPKVAHAFLAMEQQLFQKQHAIGIRKLADALCFALRIDEGKGLVLHLTDDPTVRNNRDAVAVWAQAQLADPHLAITQQTLHILADLLRRKLQSIFEGPSCN